MTTADAAELLGVRNFRMWADVRRLRPSRVLRVGSRRVAMWDVEAIYLAEEQQPTDERQAGRDHVRRTGTTSL